MAKVGHGHLLPPESEEYTSDEGSTVDDIDTPPMSPSRRIIIEMAQRIQPEPQGLTAEELLNPSGVTGATPRHSTAASPLKQCPTPRSLAQHLSGRQMDASQNQRAQAKRTSSPAPVVPNKHAKTPTRECAEPARQSRSKHRCRGGGARSQSRPRPNEVLIPAGYESTYRQERQKEEKQRRSETLKWHLEKREAEKQEVLSHGCRYVSRHAREIKDNLRPMDEIVQGFKVFGDNATIYAAYILATLEWGRMYHHYGGRDAIPILPEWLTTFNRVTKDLTTSADLPRQHVHVGHQDVRLNSVAMWQWMADLLQFWTNLSGPRLYGGVFHYPSALAEQLMADINPSIDISQCVMWEQIVNNTYGWLNARALFDQAQQTEFKRQQGRHATLNDLEKATEQLYDRS